MNSRIILLGLVVAALSSCSTAYKTGQTPDDVYFSPAREEAAYVKVENNDDRRYRADDRYRADEYVDSDDRWLRMRVRNPYRWSTFDDYGMYGMNDYRYNSFGHNSYYGYSPYNSYYSYSPFNTYSPFNNYWSNYYSWNSFYNPYYTRIIVVNPKANPVLYNRVRNFNPTSYSNSAYGNANGTQIRNGIINRPGYNNNNRTLGNSVRRVFSNSNNSGRDSYYTPSSSDRPSRTYQPSSSSSSSPVQRSSSSGSSSSGGSSGSGGVNRPSRN